MGDPIKRSPIHLSQTKGDNVFNFIDDSESILADVKMKNFEAVLESEYNLILMSALDYVELFICKENIPWLLL